MSRAGSMRLDPQSETMSRLLADVIVTVRGVLLGDDLVRVRGILLGLVPEATRRLLELLRLQQAREERLPALLLCLVRCGLLHHASPCHLSTRRLHEARAPRATESSTRVDGGGDRM